MTATPLSVERSTDAGRRRVRSRLKAAAPRWRQAATALGLVFLVSCGGSGGMGCGSGGGLGKIKGGYPVDKRIDSAISLRVSKGLFDFLSANGAAIVGGVLPADGIPVPSQCGGDTEICCGQTCKVKATFTALNFDPSPPSTMKVTIRAKMQTQPDFKVKIPVVGNCTVALDTTKSGKNDIGLALPMASTVNGETKLTNINFDTSNLDIQDIDDGDLSIGGGLLCKGVGLFKGTIISKLKDALKSQLAGPLSGALCQKCTTNDDCSSLADQGCAMDKKVCMRKGTCMQQLGIEGQLDLSGLLKSLPGAPTNALMDIYAVAGSYADIEAAPTSGMSLGMLGGSVAVNPSTCAPARPAPTGAGLAKTAAYAGNNAPNGKPFHIGAGISSVELNSLGHSFYTSGGLCLSIGTAQVEQLSSGLLSALIPSLADLTRGQNSALQIVIRPQQPPTFALGKGTFKVDGMGQKTLDDPLLTLQVKDIALDFYVYMDERMVRFMRQTADISVPLGLDIDAMGQIVPTLGDLSSAFGNVRVTDSSLLKESPSQLASLFPSLLPAVLGSIGSTLSPIKLPDVLGMKLTPVQFTSTPDAGGKLAYLGLFLALQQAPMMPIMGSPLVADSFTPAGPTALPVETYADLAELVVPTAAELRAGTATVRATLQLDAKLPAGGSPEWQYRVDGGLWRPFDDRRSVTVTDPTLRLPGNHVIEVRARAADRTDSLDPTPARVDFFVAPASPVAAAAPAESVTAHATGCSYTAGREGGLGGGVLLIVGLVAGLGLLGWRRRAHRSILMTGLVGMSLGTAACHDDGTTGDNNMMMPTGPHAELAPTDEIGRYQSAAIRDGKIYISAYDSTTGDLAFTQVGFDDAATAKLAWKAIDGLPTGAPTNNSKDAWRGGYDDPGDDVGRFTSLALTSKGTAVVAYQDVTNGAVKLAMQMDPQAGTWQTSTLTAPTEGRAPGSYISMVLDDSDVPTVAYMVQGVQKDGGKMASQLVVAHAGSSSPAGTDGWQKTVVAEAATGCGGLCPMGQACVYADPAKKDRMATLCKAVETGCTPSCKSGQACMAAKCVDVVGAPAASIPDGTGLYATLVRGGGSSYLLFHDMTKGALNLASGSDWKVTTVDGSDGKVHAGVAIGAAVAPDGTLHIAYGTEDHQILYRTFKGGMAGKVETVDDGGRTVGGASESHWVGGGLYLFLDGTNPVVAYQDQTLGSLEVARRGAMSWTHGTVGMGGDRTRGLYPQAVTKDGKWLVLDVIYDRNADALSSTAFSPL